jgi:hypothetical protein
MGSLTFADALIRTSASFARVVTVTISSSSPDIAATDRRQVLPHRGSGSPRVRMLSTAGAVI